MERIVSAVGVVDKAMELVGLVEERPRSLADLVEATGYSKATTHRLAGSLQDHGLLRRDADGRYVLGFRLVGLGRRAEHYFPLANVAMPILRELVDKTGESAQLYVREGDSRVCVAAVESPHGLRTIVERGAVLSLTAGSGGTVLSQGSSEGWVESVAEREPGVASVSAPVLSRGAVIAAVSVSGPVERLGPSPGALFGGEVMRAASGIAAVVG